jgi:hypothetical protein
MIGALLAVLPSLACAENADNSLLAYAINVNRTPVQSWPGYGIFIGKGYG